MSNGVGERRKMEKQALDNETQKEQMRSLERAQSLEKVIASPSKPAVALTNENVIDNGQSAAIDLQAAVNIPTDDEGFGDD